MSETVRDGAEGNWQASYLPAEAGCPTSPWRSQTLMMDTAHGRGKGSRKLGQQLSWIFERGLHSTKLLDKYLGYHQLLFKLASALQNWCKMLKCRQCVPPATKTLGVSPTWPIVVFFGYERNTMIFSIGPFRTVKLK